MFLLSRSVLFRFWENSNVSMSHNARKEPRQGITHIDFFSWIIIISLLAVVAALLLYIRCFTLHTQSTWCANTNAPSHTRTGAHPNCERTTFDSFAIDCATSRIYLFFIYTYRVVVRSSDRERMDTCSVKWP